MKRTSLAAALLIGVLALTGCQPDPPNTGGINGHEHPRSQDYQSGGPFAWMTGGVLALMVIVGIAAIGATGSREETT